MARGTVSCWKLSHGLCSKKRFPAREVYRPPPEQADSFWFLQLWRARQFRSISDDDALKRVRCCLKMAPRQVQVNGGCFQIRMPQDHLDRSQVGTAFEQMRCKAMAKSMWRDLLLNAGTDTSLPDRIPNNLFSDRFIGAPAIDSSGEQVRLGSHPAVILAQRSKQGFT